jgi:hypothetical protein
MPLKFYVKIQSVPQRKQHFTITKINWLTLFKEIIAFYFENHKKQIRSIGKMQTYWLKKAGGT